MNHLENHPHAFLDENSIVLNVSLFGSHDLSLLQQIQEHFSASQVVSCCEYGLASFGDEFYNGKFYPPKPSPESIRDEENGVWTS